MKEYDVRELAEGLPYIGEYFQPGWPVYKKKDVDNLIHAVKNLLAVIHRDGGHYTDENGIIKSCEDAETKIIGERKRE